MANTKIKLHKTKYLKLTNLVYENKNFYLKKGKYFCRNLKL